MKRQSIIGFFWLLLSFYCIRRTNSAWALAANPGAGFFPFIAAMAIGLIAAFRLVNVFESAVGDQCQQPAPAKAKNRPYVIAGMMAYAFLLDSLGFAFLHVSVARFLFESHRCAPAWRLSV